MRWPACLALAILLAGCGAAEVPSPPASTPVSPEPAVASPSLAPTTAATASPSQTASATAAGPTPLPSGTIELQGGNQTFTSLRYGYSLTVGSPADWLVRETPGIWNGVLDLHRSAPDPGTDWFRHPGVATIQVGFQDVPAGMTLAAWEAAEAPSAKVLDCTEAKTAQTVTVAGGKALLLPETCPKDVVGEFPGDQFFLNVFLVHGTSGVLVQWNSQQGHETADRATFLQILGTWAFTAP